MTKRRSITKGQKLSARDLKYHVSRFFLRQRSNKYNARQVAQKLKIANTKDSVQHVLDLLVGDGLIVHHKDGKYKYNNKASLDVQADASPKNIYEGKVDLTRSGDAYIVCEGLDDDVYVRRKDLKGAFNKDIVKVQVPEIKGKRRPEGKVIEIIKRSITHIIGKIVIKQKLSIVYPANKNLFEEVFINNKNTKGAEDGEQVVVKITEWGQGQNKSIWGEVTEVMKGATDNDIAMQSILLSHGFELDFPPEVIAQLKHIEPGIDEAEAKKRRDVRKVTTITIDPLTARDFDDALSYEELEDGNIEVGIHIADVTHYVPEGSPLDKEALNRSTSVYLVDRVLPMLPEKLSNDLCSLNPHEDRYTFSAIFTFDPKFNIVGEWYGRTVIHSDRRFTYEEAQEIIENKEGEYAKEILQLDKIARKLRKDKFKNGAISFESDEVQFVLDDSGKPIDTYVKARKAAHMLVEDFMLLANKGVAAYIAKKSKGVEVPFIYRVHDEPNPDKLADFALFAKALKFNMRIDTPQQIAKSFNELHKKAEEDEQYKLLQPLAIRTMSKAEYSTDNIGHYGLAFENYTHFTSPIRRYSDVLVHRLLDKNIGEIHRTDKEKLEAKAKHISLQERKANEAERESVKYKQTEYMLDHIGHEFDGVISGMIDRGIFVQLVTSKAEGLIAFDKFDEAFDVADSRLKAVGRRTGAILSLGQQIRVRILSADLDSRQIEMEILDPKEA